VEAGLKRVLEVVAGPTGSAAKKTAAKVAAKQAPRRVAARKKVL